MLTQNTNISMQLDSISSATACKGSDTDSTIGPVYVI